MCIRDSYVPPATVPPCTTTLEDTPCTITPSLDMRDENSQMFRGFGFVCFVYPQSATAAIGCMQGYELNEHRLYVSMSKPAKEASRYRRSNRSAREFMQTWQPMYEDPATMEHPMPTHKAFLQVRLPAMYMWR